MKTASGYEVDFVSEADLVQCCVSLREPGTRERELRALREAMNELGRDDATIVTLTEEEVLRSPEGTIRVVPFWRWALARSQP